MGVESNGTGRPDFSARATAAAPMPPRFPENKLLQSSAGELRSPPRQLRVRILQKGGTINFPFVCTGRWCNFTAGLRAECAKVFASQRQRGAIGRLDSKPELAG